MCYEVTTKISKICPRGVGGLASGYWTQRSSRSMSYTPPGPTALHFDFTITPYSPPTGSALHFEFAPELPPPISKELLLSLAVRLSGTVYKYWTCYVVGGQQRIRRYWEHDLDPSPWTAQYQTKFAAGVKTWQNFDDPDKIYWGKIGVRKKEPLPGYHAFLSAWLKDEVDLATFRHIRNLQIR